MTKRRGQTDRRLFHSSDIKRQRVGTPSNPWLRNPKLRSIDFSTLPLPVDVSTALADAFWNHLGARAIGDAHTHWYRVKTFGRFAAETQPLQSLADVNHQLLIRYIEWLSTQRRRDGLPWSKSTRSAMYGCLHSLLTWLLRCRPGLLGEMKFPFSPFPYRNRDRNRRRKLSPEHLRAILTACERDIAQQRVRRDNAEKAREHARANGLNASQSLGGLLECIDVRFGGVVPTTEVLLAPGFNPVRVGFERYGGIKEVEPLLYPRTESILPYYLAILIHSAGNSRAIAALAIDCLQPIPLLSDREMLVWEKPRASSLQRRSFRSSSSFEPPTLIRELLEWTSRLRPYSVASQRDDLFLFKGTHGVSSLAPASLIEPLRQFRIRHGLDDFAPASIRPSVLAAFYRASGDLLQVKSIANHAHLSTTVDYVESPEVELQNQFRVAALQIAFLKHVEPIASPAAVDHSLQRRAADSHSSKSASVPPGPVVSLFGFGCKDPFAGIASGTRAGELCTNFLGCLTCPNAIVAGDAQTLARLLQARDHIRNAASQLHLARWEAIYAPQLRILEEDILPRFAARELASAERHRSTLPPLPPLR